MVLDEPRDTSLPLIRTIISRLYGSIPSAVTIQGPITFPVSKSLLLEGPSPPGISIVWVSLALTSLKMEKPKI